jgi:hypothetical protein
MAILLASLPDPGVDAAAGGDSLRSAPLFPPPPPYFMGSESCDRGRSRHACSTKCAGSVPGV